MSILTSLQVNKNIKYMLENMSNSFQKCDIKHFSRYFDAGLESDDFIELKDFNNNLYSTYSSPV